MPLLRSAVPAGLLLCAVWVAGAAAASDEPITPAEPATLKVVAPPGQAVIRMSFGDFYRRPVGPRGLEPGPRLLASAGSRVQLTGFVAHGPEGAAPPDFAIMAPLPVSLGDEDEGLADDLPAAVAYVHWTDPRVAASLAGCHRAVRVTGRLELGRSAESDGRMSFVRLQADDVQCAP